MDLRTDSASSVSLEKFFLFTYLLKMTASSVRILENTLGTVHVVSRLSGSWGLLFKITLYREGVFILYFQGPTFTIVSIRNLHTNIS